MRGVYLCAASHLPQGRIGVHASLGEGGHDDPVEGPLGGLILEPVEVKGSTPGVVVLGGAGHERDLLGVGEAPEGGDEGPEGGIVAL